MPKQKVIAIDGPGASGKGTVSVRVAAALGRDYLDSGALYRLTAVYAQQQGVAPDDAAGLAACALRLPAVFSAEGVLLDGAPAEALIRTEEAGMMASAVAALPAVRAALLQRQRDFLGAKGLVADGRDMGSVVFPDAELKVFLTASAAVRARRRALQLGLDGDAATLGRIRTDIERRDEADRNRKEAPLKAAEGAYILDTSELDIDGSVQKVLDWYRLI